MKTELKETELKETEPAAPVAGTINPEWEALDDKPHLVSACCMPGAYDEINVGPTPIPEKPPAPELPDLNKFYIENTK